MDSASQSSILQFDPPVLHETLKKALYFTFIVTCRRSCCCGNNRPSVFVAFTGFKMAACKLAEELISALFLIGLYPHV